MGSFSGAQDTAAGITQGHVRLCLNGGTRQGVLSSHAQAHSPASPSHVRGRTRPPAALGWVHRQGGVIHLGWAPSQGHKGPGPRGLLCT